MANSFIGTLLRPRDASPPPPGPTMSHSTLNLILILLILLVLALFLAGGLLCWRHYWRYRAAQEQHQQQLLPLHSTSEKRSSTASASSRRHRRVMERPGQSPYLFQDKQALLSQHDSPSPPPSPVPEIRVTLPEELVDGKRHSGRVVVLRVGEMGSEGLEPIPEEQLPPYNDGERFQSLDLERAGGLMEKPGLLPPPPGWRR